MGGLYLILHKVRGELAFDVAQRVAIEDEEVWFIPTSGHRAYPYGYKALPQSFEHVTGSVWHALPDHYSCATQRKGSLARLRARLWEIWKVRAKRDVGKGRAEGLDILI
jgi:hypothetical protein